MPVKVSPETSRTGPAKMRKIFLMLCLITPLMTACNTLEGVGKDLSKAGEAIRKAADEAKTDP
jgi:predicted small secreted protein